MSRRITFKDSLASRHLYKTLSTKETEHEILLGFLKRILLDNCDILPSERPDFILKYTNNDVHVSIGVEVTVYYSDVGIKGSPQARFVKQWKAFNTKLRQRLKEYNQENQFLYGAIHFKKSSFDVFKGVNINILADEIAKLVILPKKSKTIRKISKKKYPLTASLVEHIYLLNTTPEKNIIWWPAHLQSGIIVDGTDRLISIIKVKNNKARTYNWMEADEKWLLIYSGTQGLSNMLGNYDNPEVEKKLGRLFFDKIYVWNKFLESIEETYPTYKNVFSIEDDMIYRKKFSPIIRPFIGMGK